MNQKIRIIPTTIVFFILILTLFSFSSLYDHGEVKSSDSSLVLLGQDSVSLSIISDNTIYIESNNLNDAIFTLSYKLSTFYPYENLLNLYSDDNEIENILIFGINKAIEDGTIKLKKDSLEKYEPDRFTIYLDDKSFILYNEMQIDSTIFSLIQIKCSNILYLGAYNNCYPLLFLISEYGDLIYNDRNIEIIHNRFNELDSLVSTYTALLHDSKDLISKQLYTDMISYKCSDKKITNSFPLLSSFINFYYSANHQENPAILIEQFIRGFPNDKDSNFYNKNIFFDLDHRNFSNLLFYYNTETNEIIDYNRFDKDKNFKWKNRVTTKLK
ncbi:MAG: hypothetical protein JXR48_06860 [Candidatus Delongbacteria bacterium]|nr:hypothetical protein [Candidatus Delongbacteria bacterium]MBN2834671.1 hypothetical protein [Candidatus Delongbacteria bacterium]